MKSYTKKPSAYPTDQCENCKRWYHARRLKCPKCGAPNPTRNPAQNGDPIQAAIAFVEQAGGVEQAKAALETIERIRGL